MKKNKPSALQAWKMLILSLPKGVAAFVTVTAGLSVSLPLSVILIGLPLLAETLVLCSGMLESERRKASFWSSVGKDEGEAAETAPQRSWGGWRNLLAVLAQRRYYRGILYGFLQLPIGIAAFVLALVLPVTGGAILLSPLAYQISSRFYSFELFSDPVFMDRLLPAWSDAERSWLVGGIGAVFVLLMPFAFRILGRLYSAWILSVAGNSENRPVSAIHAEETTFPDQKLPEPQLYA